LHCAALRCIALHCAALRCIALHCAALYHLYDVRDVRLYRHLYDVDPLPWSQLHPNLFLGLGIPPEPTNPSHTIVISQY
jgi:hypothetical protein